MADPEIEGIEAEFLSAANVDEIYALYLQCRSAAPAGFLAERTRNDYLTFYREPQNVIGLGSRSRGQLIGYLGLHRIHEHPYGDRGLFADIRPDKEITYSWHGRLVHPEYRGRNLSHQLVKVLQGEFVRRRIVHRLSLIAVDNIAGIETAMRSTGLFLGFARDPTSMNYLNYAGSLRNRLRAEVAQVAVHVGDHALQGDLFLTRAPRGIRLVPPNTLLFRPFA